MRVRLKPDTNLAAAVSVPQLEGDALVDRAAVKDAQYERRLIDRPEV